MSGVHSPTDEMLFKHCTGEADFHASFVFQVGSVHLMITTILGATTGKQALLFGSAFLSFVLLPRMACFLVAAVSQAGSPLLLCSFRWGSLTWQ